MIAYLCATRSSAAILCGCETTVSKSSLNECLIGVRTQRFNDCTVLNDTIGNTRLGLMARADAVHVYRAACAQGYLVEDT